MREISELKVETRWVKTGIGHDFVFLGKDVIATASGVHIIFFNLTTKTERVECFVTAERGDGACCLAGHPVVPMFSLVERLPNPNIFVYTYPKLAIVSKCKLINGSISYLSCCFSGTEYLLSLTSFPKFEIIVWLWRTGEKCTSILTNTTDDLQKLQPSVHSPLFISHYAINARVLSVYEIHASSKQVSLMQTEIKLPNSKIICHCWLSDGHVAVCDEEGHVFTVNTETKKSHLITQLAQATSEQKKISFRCYQNGFLAVDANSKITMYKKMPSEGASNDVWNPAWSIDPPSHPLIWSPFQQKDCALFHAEDGDIYEILSQDWKPVIQNVKSEGRKYKFLVLINPDGQYSVVIDYLGKFSVLDNVEGKFEDSLYLEPCEEVITIASHPNSPLIAVNTASGRCICITVTKSAKFMVCQTFHLTTQPLDGVRFSDKGEILGVTTTSMGDIFLINTNVNKEMVTLFHKCTEKPIVDFLIYETSPSQCRIVILFLTSTMAKVGSIAAVYNVQIRVNGSQEKYYIAHLSHILGSLHYGPENVCDFIGLPYLSKEFQFYKIQDDNKAIVLSETLSTTHQLRKFDVNVTKSYIVTCGFDGLVIITETSNPSKLLTLFMPHHRRQHGTRSSIITPSGNNAVSLGRDGSLVGISIKYKNAEHQLPIEVYNIDEWQAAAKIDPCDSNAPTWLESLRLKKLEKEKDEAYSLRSSILEHFELIKNQVKALLDENERRSEIASLPIFAFDLNVAGREKKIQHAVFERNEVQKNLESKAQRQDDISEYIRRIFRDTRTVQDCMLFSFNGETKIDNYALRHTDSQATDDFSIMLFDIMPPTLFDNEEVIDRDSQMTISSLSTKTKKEETAEVNVAEVSDDDDVYTSSGITSHRWIKDIPDDGKKRQSNHELVVPMEYRLKVYFNDRFNYMKLFKTDMIQSVSQRLTRLNYCKRQLEDMFGTYITETFTYPTSSPFENPDYVITVDDQVESTEIEKLDTDSLLEGSEYVVEVGRFKKKKLDEMMDGLLEVRWEDVIKWDIPKPDFMIKKSPADYTPEDVKALEQYKQKVANLEADRQKYKSQLRREIAMIRDQIKEDINSFNQKMKAFYLEKIKIQCAILQEFSLRLSIDKKKVIEHRDKDHIELLKQNELLPAENEAQDIAKVLPTIESTLMELKSRYDNFIKREKLLEGKFRGEFPDLKLPMMEHLTRHFKRRPKIDKMVCTSITYLTEMSRCLMSGESSIILPRECLDILRIMNDVEVMPSNLPAQIEQSHWQVLCKLRRNKVDLEIKIKITALQIAEVEQTLSFYQKLHSSMQTKINTLKTTIETEIATVHSNANDFDVQLVLKCGQIEVISVGHVDDLKNATTVPHGELLKINESIIITGQKKLSAMQMSINYRNTVLWAEWKHERMKMQMMDLQEDLKALEGAKSGKAFRSYLMESAEVKSRTKDDEYINRVIQSTLTMYRRKTLEREEELNKISSNIKFWTEKNAKIDTLIDNAKAKHSELSVGREVESKRLETFRSRLKAIMKRTNMVKLIEKNYNELLTLQTHLELLRLKTYPTLNLNT